MTTTNSAAHPQITTPTGDEHAAAEAPNIEPVAGNALAQAPPDSAAATPQAPPLEPPPAAEHVHEIIIEPRRGWISVNWAELWHQRELLYFLIWRDVKVRYKQTVLGFAWAFIQPLFTAAMFTIIFSALAKVEFENVPYPAAVFVGIWAWTFISTSISSGGNSLANQAFLLTKVYLPRLYLPAAAIGVALVDMGVTAIMMALVLAYFGVVPGWGILMLPPLIVMTSVGVMGITCWVAALTVTYRDVRNLVAFALQLGIYASAVMFPPSLVPERWQWALTYNPAAQIIIAFRAALVGTPWNWHGLGIAAITCLALLLFGLYYFRRAERRFADVA
jgi:lipopolysaccharide transport system permease protein